MSEPVPAYNHWMAKSWVALSIAVGLLLLSMFVFGDGYLALGGTIWKLLRFLASPLI